MKQMLLRDTNEDLNASFGKGPDFTVLNAGEFIADPQNEEVEATPSLNVNFKEKEMVILGS
jgi:ATP-dependent phosphoenolpyruvate carboxykinase